MEIWKHIAGHPGYCVSDQGRVRSARMILRPFVVKSTGYMQINLSKRTRHFVHRLVAAAFCEKLGGVVNHLNGIKADNRAVNLEWTTQAANNLHNYRVLGQPGSCSGRQGARHPKSIPVIAKCILTGDELWFASGSDAKRALPRLTSTGIAASCKGKIRHHAGYVFRYAQDEMAQFAPTTKQQRAA